MVFYNEGEEVDALIRAATQKTTLTGYFQVCAAELEAPLTAEALGTDPETHELFPRATDLTYLDFPSYYTWDAAKKNCACILLMTQTIICACILLMIPYKALQITEILYRLLVYQHHRSRDLNKWILYSQLFFTSSPMTQMNKKEYGQTHMHCSIHIKNMFLIQ